MARAFRRWSPDFLRALEETGNVALACRKANVGRRTVYRWRNKDTKAGKAFREAWDEALEVACDVLEAEARRRAMAGVKEEVFYRGEVVGETRRYSDTLLIFLLKAHRPEKFSERYRLEHVGKDGGPIEHRAVILPDNGRDDASD